MWCLKRVNSSEEEKYLFIPFSYIYLRLQLMIVYIINVLTNAYARKTVRNLQLQH